LVIHFQETTHPDDYHPVYNKLIDHIQGQYRDTSILMGISALVCKDYPV